MTIRARIFGTMWEVTEKPYDSFEDASGRTVPGGRGVKLTVLDEDRNKATMSVSIPGADLELAKIPRDTPVIVTADFFASGRPKFVAIQTQQGK